MMEITYQITGPEGLPRIGPLWRQLTEHHGSRSPHFKSRYARMSFDERQRDLLAARQVRVETAHDGAGTMIGYCVSSLRAAAIGELDSLFVAEPWRGHGIGMTLAHHALEWLRSNGADIVSVIVAFGNEEAWPFYARLGLYPSHTVLRSGGEGPARGEARTAFRRGKG